MSADHQRLAVIDALLEVGTPVDAEDAVWGRQALRVAAGNGRVDGVRHLLEHGSDPNHRDPEQGLARRRQFGRRGCRACGCR
ncbi:hypothetical protein [Kribbella sp. NPDC049227]|uniref:hypothetical protein n=1 Tax=Kribbella sp. NPDC049227 TaxID=3364113 RepID=UPI0037202266